MNLALLYVLMLKATLTTLNGPSSLPVLREDMVVRHRVITDRQLNAAVTAARSAPGPMGIYVVSVGYQAAGWPGAAVGWLAMITPAFLVVPLLRTIGTRSQSPTFRRILEGMILASVGLIVASGIPLARAAFTGTVPVAIGIVSCGLIAATRVNTLWVIAGGAAIAGCLHIVLH
jgi:chromate transporter